MASTASQRIVETVPCPASVDGLISACDKAADALKAAQTLIAAQQAEIQQLRQAHEGFEVRLAELEVQLENKQQEINELDQRLIVAKRTTKLAALGGFILGLVARLKF